MLPVTVVIPNYNGEKYLKNCIESLISSEEEDFNIIVVDDCSVDGSGKKAAMEYPKIRLIENKKNLGFAASVNIGVRAASDPYVVLLNNDTVVKTGFVNFLLKRIKSNTRYFSVQAKMVSLQNPEIVDSAGDYYTILGWARARGNGKPSSLYNKPAGIFSACGGAAIYRRELLISLGLFDEAHFAYLEDVDIGYRALLAGFQNVFEPRAVVLHAGSATSGSRHNSFKVRLSAGNSLYLAYKNMPPLQLILNSPFLLAGHMIKLVYFTKKGLGLDYIKGIKRGISLIKKYNGAEIKSNKKISLVSYIKIQLLLIMNLRYLRG